MTTDKAIEYHSKSLKIWTMIRDSEVWIESWRKDLKTIQGIYNKPKIDHDIEISQAVIIRLRMRLDRLKYTYGL